MLLLKQLTLWYDADADVMIFQTMDADDMRYGVKVRYGFFDTPVFLRALIFLDSCIR
jgi:hypothetical protein